MGFTASLPAEAGGGRERQRHAHQRFDQQGRQESVLGSEGRREDQQVRLVVRGPHSEPRQRHLPDAERERQRLSPAGSALRGAQPDQGVGGGSRLDDSHSDRQREELARRGALGGARTRIRTWCCSRSSRPASTARSPKIKNLRQAQALSAGQHLHGHRTTSASPSLDDETAGRRT